jgi:hypothetical protein
MFFRTSKWKDTLAHLAPTIKESLGTELESSALKALATKLQKDSLTVDELKAKIEAGLTASDMEQLKEVEDEFSILLKHNNIKLGQKRCWGSSISFLDIMQHAMAIGITYGFFILLFGIADGTYNLKDSEALTILVGSLTTAWLTIVGYIYGTSISSRLKDKAAQKQE